MGRQADSGPAAFGLCGFGLATLGFAAVLAIGVVSGGTAAVAGQVYGLVVGIDDYGDAGRDLYGAVADAADIAGSLRRLGAANVTLLNNQAASKLAITAAWSDIAARAKRGDTVIFSFAGRGAFTHGESFVLSKFSTGGGGEERLSRQEILAWFKQVDAAGVNAVFVGDASFGGALARPLPADGPRYRQWSNRAPSEPAGGAQLGENDFSYGLFAYAAQPGGADPEIDIAGRPRGALSWALARGLSGRADEDGDGQITDTELAHFLTLAVPVLTEGQQSPRVVPRRSASHVLFSAPPAAAGRIAPLHGGGDLRFAVVGGEEAALPGAFPGVTTVDDPEDADLVWHAETGQVVSRIGGVVAEKIGAKQMANVLASWSALTWLKGQAALNPAPVKLFSGDARAAPGALVQIEMLPGRYAYLTLFDLMPDGSVVLLSPTDSQAAAKDWRHEHMHQMFEVGDDASGAMHRVAILSKSMLPGLQTAIARMQADKSATGLRQALEAALPPGAEAEIGIFPIYMGAADKGD